jgi:hypothetical protein
VGAIKWNGQIHIYIYMYIEKIKKNNPKILSFNYEYMRFGFNNIPTSIVGVPAPRLSLTTTRLVVRTSATATTDLAPPTTAFYPTVLCIRAHREIYVLINLAIKSLTSELKINGLRCISLGYSN